MQPIKYSETNSGISSIYLQKNTQKCFYYKNTYIFAYRTVGILLTMKDTKDLILKTAYNMFLYNNYEAVTINSIIKAAGLTKGSLYHYYLSKEELFKEVVDKYMMENTDTSVAFLTLKEFIQYTIDMNKGKLTKLFINKPNSQLDIPLHYLTITIAALRYYPNFVKKGAEFYQNQVDQWEKSLSHAIKNGEIRDDIDTEATISLFLNIGSGIGRIMIKGASLSVALDIIERQYWELYKHIKK